MYKILEARIEIRNSRIKSIAVLVDLTNNQSKALSDVRAIVATDNPRGGYMHIQANATLSNELLQEVAGQGSEVTDRDKIFPKWKSKLVAGGAYR